MTFLHCSRIRSPTWATVLYAGAPEEFGLVDHIGGPDVNNGWRGAQERQAIGLSGQKGDYGGGECGLEETERLALQVGVGDDDASDEVVAFVVDVVGEDSRRVFAGVVKAGLRRFGDRQGGADQGGRRREVQPPAENHDLFRVRKRN